ncbi:MAG: DNA mismatch repair endonuclease MutL [Candidatus Eremiobacteraeota bacterium]|nr:DNA mismatch repair endonuclease MutL [Candidatus Eremiobacteraeota bacterium]MBC5802554.1 DNA mismatch repair endonuclease MutL [Candidatus Eremiobacteraeota bacterium]MBC5821915.1 DNA mismatch repair endonuclease MutL [Candidatus Eremiobacteraeota bacterium]
MIRLLDETTVGAIAAGEVVERPLSVAKELVENALDAGATRIGVAVTRGGLDALEVTDDGVGIACDDLRLAFARHATSKLARVADLERIATLGFRGEGLAAIAAVARVRLESRTRDSDIGYAVHAHGLDVSQPEPIAAPPGTRVRVEALFANVPVRRDYLRSPTAEFARISSFLAMLGLGYPSVAFNLTHDGRTAFTFPAAGTLDQRLAHVFGTDAARSLVALEPSDGAARVRGFVSPPGVDRGDRRLQLLFVNGRLLRSTLLAGAWSAAYATFALRGRHPFGLLFVDVPPDHVDPNVHPTKSDVRLRFADAVHDVVRRSIARALARDATSRLRDALSFAPPLQATAAAPSQDAGSSNPHAALFGAETSRELAVAATSPDANEVPPGELRILAQLDDTFVLATDGSALVLVDQHAAHERVAFEAIAARARSGTAVQEPLLVPYGIELDADEAERFERSRSALAAAGLEAEPFGERAYRILTTPAGYGARAFDLRAYVADLAEDAGGLDARERVWASLACHSVVRAGERLEHAEMTALLARLVRCKNPMHCPHGRPTIVRIEADAIARMFKRT